MRICDLEASSSHGKAHLCITPLAIHQGPGLTADREYKGCGGKCQIGRTWLLDHTTTSDASLSLVAIGSWVYEAREPETWRKRTSISVQTSRFPASRG